MEDIDTLDLLKEKQRDGETFTKYLQRWRVVASRMKSPPSEKEMVTLLWLMPILKWRMLLIFIMSLPSQRLPKRAPSLRERLSLKGKLNCTTRIRTSHPVTNLVTRIRTRMQSTMASLILNMFRWPIPPRGNNHPCPTPYPCHKGHLDPLNNPINTIKGMVNVNKLN